MGQSKLLHAFAPSSETWATEETVDGGTVHNRVAYYGMVEERVRRSIEPERFVAAFRSDGSMLNVHNYVTKHVPCDKVADGYDICDGHPKADQS